MTLTIEFDASYSKIYNLDKSKEYYSRLKTQLSYEDSKIAYSNKIANYSTYKDPTVCLLDKDNRFYTGLLARVVWVLDNCGVDYNLVRAIDPVQPSLTLNLPDWLYPHQVELIQRCIDIKRGVVQSPTGSGKSIAIAWLINHFPTQEIIVTVPEKSLLKQLKATLEKVTGEEIGVYTGSKKVFKRITIGIINSLSKLAKKDPNLFSTVEVLICDEAHRVGANFYTDLCLACKNTDYRLGFSATAWRQAGDDKVMEGLLGPLMLKINEQDLIDKGILTRPVFIEVPFKSPVKTYKKYNPSTGGYYTKNGKPDRNEVYTHCIVKNPTRNNLIVNIAIEYLKSNPILPCLILVQNIEHGEILQELFNLEGKALPFVYGKSSLTERTKIVEELKNGTLLAAIASSVFNEGQDIPNLGLGIIAGGGGSESRIIQQVGRFIRRYPNKDKGIIIDIADDESYYLQYNFLTRKQRIDNTYPSAHIKLTPDRLMEYTQNGFKDL